ncbi:MAG: tripartite tricarboxylate transporter substrate binding protein [Variibacter sp.]|nr:tripartite tricarboxylate transporter substrate binding protein [Variibacter sp.]
MSRNGFSALAAGLLAAGMLCGVVQAQDFPNRPVKIIVPYTAGGGTDAIARPLAQRLSEKWGQPVVIENRPGAGTAIGAEAVARAAPDGYTLLLSDATTYAINPHVYKKLSYDPLKDFAPVAIVCRFTPVVAINPEVPAKTFAEFIAWAKERPGKPSYGSFGNGTYAHVAMEEIKRAAGIDMVHVPYRGGAPVVTDLLSGQISSTIATVTNFLQHHQAGKLRIIAAATEKRPSLLPDLPTVGETLPGYAIDVFVAVAAPPGTPAATVDKISRDIAAIVAEPAYREKNLSAQYFEPVGSTPAEFAATLKRDNARWSEMVQRAGIKID